MLSANNITKSFGRLEVLKGINLQIEKGEFVSIVGASGAGKTTLLQILGTLDKPDSGKVVINGTDVFKLNNKELAAFRNKHLGFVFQFHQLLPEFTAMENVMIPALIARRSNSEAQKAAREMLERLGLCDRLDHKPAELSGGEKQRVSVARALINNPELILADEPSGSLDSANKVELHNLLLTLNRDLGITLLVVTHDNDLAKLAHRTITIADGDIVVSG